MEGRLQASTPASNCPAGATFSQPGLRKSVGIYHEFPVLPGRSQAECFAAGFDIVDAGEEYGLDVMWLAELHFDKARALAVNPRGPGIPPADPPGRGKVGADGLVRAPGKSPCA